MSVQKKSKSAHGNKKEKKGWKKIANTLQLSEDSYATFPINFTSTSLEDLYLELHTRFFDPVHFNGQQKLTQHKQHATDFVDCGDKFYSSMKYEQERLASVRPTDFTDMVNTYGKYGSHLPYKKRKSGFLNEKARELKKVQIGHYSKISHVKYNLRSLPPMSFSEKFLQRNATDRQNLSDFNVQQDDSLRNHLYIEALMYFEPLIFEATVLDEDSGQRRPLVHKMDKYDNYGSSGFVSVDSRSNYFKEIVSNMESIIHGFDHLNYSGKHSGPGPQPELFANWYLSHIANSEKNKIAFTYKPDGSINSLVPQYWENSVSRWPDERLVPSCMRVALLTFNTDELEMNPHVAVHNVHDNGVLIEAVREHIKNVPRELLQMYKDDIEQFTKDHRNIRHIWYHPNELAEDANNWNMNGMQIYEIGGLKEALEKNLQMKTSTANRGEYESGIKYKTPAMIALQLCMYVLKHPFFKNTCDRFPRAANKGTFKWIAKVICLWDMQICSSFVDMIEGGMTAYDWPAWAFMQLKNFKNTHSLQTVKERLSNNPLFEEWELNDMDKYLKSDGLDEIISRQLFLPALNQTTHLHHFPVKGRKKRKI